jgi:hypothetical protein
MADNVTPLLAPAAPSSTQPEVAWPLLTGERLIWTGRPKQGLTVTAREIPEILFSLAWFGFTIYWEVKAVSHGAPWTMQLFGVPFVLIGFYFVIGRRWFDAWLRGSTHYAITDRRILIVREGAFAKFTGLSRANLPQVDLVEHRDGRGTVRFGQVAVSSKPSGESDDDGPARTDTPKFIAIENARAVFDEIQRPSSVSMRE